MLTKIFVPISSLETRESRGFSLEITRMKSVFITTSHEGGILADIYRYIATDDETFSITSSIFNYQYENGRRYHAFREGALESIL